MENDEKDILFLYRILQQRLDQTTSDFVKEYHLEDPPETELNIPFLIQQTKELIANPMLQFATAIMFPVHDFVHEGVKYSLTLSVQETKDIPLIATT